MSCPENDFKLDIIQERESFSINNSDTSISRSKQLESTISPSKISALSSGEFIGMVADDPDSKIELKTFHCELLNDHVGLKKEQDNYKELPIIHQLDDGMVQRNYLQIKQDAHDIIQSEMERLMNDQGLAHLVGKKVNPYIHSHSVRFYFTIICIQPRLKLEHPNALLLFNE